MAKIFITGSSDGLGHMAATQLLNQGHEVVLHARNMKRGEDAIKKTPGADSVLIGELSDMEQTKQLAADANKLGAFDVVIHNAGVYQNDTQTIIRVNTLAPYILTGLMHKPKRLIYLSSGMHKGGNANLDALERLDGISYSDSKLHDLLLTKAIARKWPEVYANAVDPGWVPTKMGGASATEDLEKGFQTQAWLSISDDVEAMVTGGYFYHMQQSAYNSEADNEQIQDRFIQICQSLTGVELA